MSDGPSIDFSALDRMIADFGEVPAATTPFLVSALGRTSHLIVDAWRGKLAGSAHWAGLPRRISYTISGTAGPSTIGQVLSGGGGSELRSEIGPRRGGQGSLGHINELGSPTSPPSGFGHAALQENEGDFARGIERALDDGLRAAGLA